MDFVIFIAAMSALVVGADYIIKESERIALHFNISHFIIGATLVAFGTSLPEMAASMMASYQGKSDMAVANVVGSGIFNITLILGIVFLIAKQIAPTRDLFAKDSAWTLIPVIIFLMMIYDGVIGRFDGFLLLFLMVAYLTYLFISAKEDLEGEIDEDLSKESFNWIKTSFLIIVGFTLTIGGANFVIESGTNIARIFGVSEWIIGLFLISFGTSLPELVVSLVSIKKGNADLSIGNIIGSNVANISMVLGGSALVAPLLINLQQSMFDIYTLVAASFALLLIMSNKIYNKTGAILLLILLMLFLQNSITSL
jgi:cation:H+ antiporter